MTTGREKKISNTEKVKKQRSENGLGAKEGRGLMRGGRGWQRQTGRAQTRLAGSRRSLQV